MGNLGLTDAPLESLAGELLGVSEHIGALVTFISQCNTPMTIAIQGDWGTGKTSMMNLVRSRLTDLGIESVWFNTWQFSQFNLQEDVPVALLMELLQSIGIEESKLKDMALGLFKRTAEVGAAFLGGKGVSDVVNKFFSASPLDIFAQIKQLRENVQNAINTKLKNGRSDRLAIFVDDLDRMNPGKAVELLEVIKNFLDLKGCVFVLAVDYGVVSAGARMKYGAEMDEAKGRSFFDKIIQLPFNLPVSQYNIGRYLKNILNIRDDELPYYRELAANSIGTNPRSLKRMANVMNLLELLAAKNYGESLKKPEFRRMLFAILCLQMAYEPAYNAIISTDDRSSIMSAAPEERAAMFAASLDKCPGPKEEVSARFASFLDALIKTVPQLPNEDEADFDFFNDVLEMSGLTSSGSQILARADKVKSSFDPILFAKLAELSSEATIKFRSFWELIGKMPEFRMSDAHLIMPVIFGATVDFGVHITPDGFTTRFSSAYSRIVKKPFYELLKRILPDYADVGRYRGNAYSFIDFPFVEWKVPASDKSAEASQMRYVQVRDTLYRHTDIFIPLLERAYPPQLQVLNSLHAFISRIARRLASTFTTAGGWEIAVAEKGVAVIDYEKMIQLRKKGWDDGVSLILTHDIYGVYVGVAQKRNDKITEDKEVGTLYNRWLEATPEVDKDSTGQEANLAFYAYLPKNLRHWIRGSYLSANFSYTLSSEQETAAMEAICGYFSGIRALEKEFDDWAARQDG